MDVKNSSLIKIGSRKITRKEKSGSFQITIPADLVKHMELNEGDQLIFYKDPNDSGYTIAIKSYCRNFPAMGISLSLQSLKGRESDE